MEALLTTVSDYLVRQSLQIPAVFVLVAAACWGLRKASAHWRYLLWLIVLAKCLVPALISVPLAVMPQEDKSPQIPPLALSTPIAISTPDVKPTPVGMAMPESEMAIESSRPIAAPIMPTQREVTTSSNIDVAKIVSRINLNGRDSIAIGWLAGVGLFLTYISLRAWTMQRRLRRSRRMADPELRTMVAALAKRLKLTITPTVYMADGIAQPFVWGWLRGSIYLPGPFVDSATREQQEAVLTHELAHIVRWDAAANLVQIMTQAGFFFHPLIWWTNRQIRREREKCCDEFVIASSVTDPKQYSQAIVSALVAEYESNQSVPSLAVAGRLKNIEERIQTILNPRGRFYRRPSWVAVATVACLTVCAVPTALVLTARGGSADQQSASAAQQTPPTPSETDAVVEAKDRRRAPDADTDTCQPGQVLDFRVINAKTKEPLSDVKLKTIFSSGEGSSYRTVEGHQTTDAQGRCEIKLPDWKPERARFYPSKAGFVPLRIYWDGNTTPPLIPKTVTLPLEPGTVWGGIVQNEKGEPIPDAKVTVNYWESPAGNLQPHLRANIDEETTTDKDGRWRINVMPAEVIEDQPRIFLSHPDYVSDHLDRGIPMPITERPAIEALYAQTAVMVMRKGLAINGRIVDEDGKPIAGAMLYDKEQDSVDRPGAPAATSDENGRFQIPNVNAHGAATDRRRRLRSPNDDSIKRILAVQAPGYTPEIIEADLSTPGKPLDITLKPGQAIQGHVVDENGKPVAGVLIWIEMWQQLRSRICLTATTDTDGKFRLIDAPLGDATYTFRKEGYMMAENFSMSPANQEQPDKQNYVVTLSPPLQIIGSIVDAETNKPVTKCRVIEGGDYNDGRAPEWHEWTAKTITDGQYEIEFRQKLYCYRVRVEAEGYMPAVSRIFKPGDLDKGRVTYDFKLSKAAPFAGTVLGSDGQPLANAEVVLATNPLRVNNRRASSDSLRNNRLVQTDATGRFELPPEVEPFYLVVLHDQGYAVINEEQFARTPDIRIQPWTDEKRIFGVERRPSARPDKPPAADSKGTRSVRLIDVDGKPVEGAHVATYAGFCVSSNRFVPYDSGWIYSPNILSDRDGMARIADLYNNTVVARHVEKKLVAVRSIGPVQTSGSDVVTLTMQPECKVFGTLTAREMEARNRKIAWSNVYVYLDDGIGRPLSCGSEKADYHFYLPPGTYKLDAYSMDTQDVWKSITVKPGQQELEVEPIDLPPTGLVLLEGQPAPELRDIVAWKNGGPIKLSDLRGKVVILAFTSGWSGERMGGIMPELFPLYDKYHDQGLVIIEIRLDYGLKIDSEAQLNDKLAEVKKPFWKNRDVPVPIALVHMNLVPRQPDAKKTAPCPILEDYGIRGVPTGVLIDRQGRVVREFDPRSQLDDAAFDAILEKVIKEK